VKVLLYCRNFAPSVGGTEKLFGILAREFVGAGHAVTVATETPDECELPYPVNRRPGFGELVRLARASEVIVTAPLSLRRLPALMLARRPIAAAHPSWHEGRAARLKDLVARFFTNIVPSRFLAGYFPGAIVIHNPFEAGVFKWPEGASERSGIVFVGRLEEIKGCQVLVRAFARIAAAYPDVPLTIAGEGPQRAELEALARELGVAERIAFRGLVTGPALVELLQASRIMVVPTLIDEAFGIVALEGLASGCRLVGARSGGLPEAVGDQAIVFERGDDEACAAALCEALAETGGPDRAAVERHLAQFQPERIAARYLDVFANLVRRSGQSKHRPAPRERTAPR